MKHTKSAGGIVLNSEKVLIVSQMGTSWSLPKGHIDSGEDALSAAIREIDEESGITDLTLIKELGSYSRYKISKSGGEDKSELKTITLFLFTTLQTELNPKDPHNPEARWVDKNEVIDLLTHKSDKEFYASMMRYF